MDRHMDDVNEAFIAFIAASSLSTQNVVSGRHLSHKRSWHVLWRLV